ncbi:hypothetical protein J2T57_001590 [Natronocella acetinitrilica]|uniref:Uncharacterized protein n=1 Tax=Natronocella acetinitrilica TaxID=414046 RepID=A0AAE3G4Y7_9GAMM|nr:hypothetical protein [Natronocella acetinitrilica]MCP1674488.1 hypothetical protein [Natronocella acetinitrilica]
MTEPQQYLNQYECPECQNLWDDVWDSACDDDCGECGLRHISPYESTDLPCEASRSATG